jgi:hypothetical protein
MDHKVSCSCSSKINKMLSLSSQLRLKSLLEALGDHELKAEEIRQQLCSIEHFEPCSAFKLIDSLKTSKITVKDLDHLFK